MKTNVLPKTLTVSQRRLNIKGFKYGLCRNCWISGYVNPFHGVPTTWNLFLTVLFCVRLWSLSSERNKLELRLFYQGNIYLSLKDIASFCVVPVCVCVHTCTVSICVYITCMHTYHALHICIMLYVYICSIMRLLFIFID